jgi:hypothetical protein
MFWYVLVKLQPREAMCIRMDYFQPFLSNSFPLISLFFSPCELIFFLYTTTRICMVS